MFPYRKVHKQCVPGIILRISKSQGWRPQKLMLFGSNLEILTQYSRIQLHSAHLLAAILHSINPNTKQSIITKGKSSQEFFFRKQSMWGIFIQYYKNLTENPKMLLQVSYMYAQRLRQNFINFTVEYLKYITTFFKKSKRNWYIHDCVNPCKLLEHL